MSELSPTPLTNRSRAVAMAHRRARGANRPRSTAPSAAAPRSSSQRAAPARRNAVVNATNVPVQAGREAAKQRRKMQTSGNKSSATSASTSSRRTRIKPKLPQPIPSRADRTSTGSAVVVSSPAVSTTRSQQDKRKGVKNRDAAAIVPLGRQLSKAWRSTSAKGKVAQHAYKSKGNPSGALAKMSDPSASTRDIAKKVRAARCSKGGNCAPSSSESSTQQRRSRRKSNTVAPAKVSFSETLRGQAISGGHVGQGKMTGAEVGSCQRVSGTEYLGAEEFTTHCGNNLPPAAPSKISQTQTTRGQTVSGTEVGRSSSVSGDLAGQCQAVTGTEYLPADQSELFCQADSPVAATPAASERRGSVMSAPTRERGQTKVTGAETPMTKAKPRTERRTSVMSAPQRDPSQQAATVTGAEKLEFNAKQRQAAPAAPAAPRKVMPATTALGNTTTGTQVGRLETVTGDHRGYCQSVTGTGYQSQEEATAVCQTPPPPAPSNPQRLSRTLNNQAVTGERAGAINGATGSEAGVCKAVTGTPYMGLEGSAETCSVEQLEEISARREVSHQGRSLTGTEPGVTGLTGAQKGACSLITGTEYHSANQTNAYCGSAQPGDSDFPLMLNNATPAAAPVSTTVTSPAESSDTAEEASSNSRITGDGWDRGAKVTGTEGHWAAQRNTSLRGQTHQSPMSAMSFRPSKEMEDVPQSPITGSAGNTGQGAKVTLSGGARA
ncbi:MAG: CsoS2 family carboxysome shell protein [bacterium]